MTEFAWQHYADAAVQENPGLPVKEVLGRVAEKADIARKGAEARIAAITETNAQLREDRRVIVEKLNEVRNVLVTVEDNLDALRAIHAIVD